MANRFQQFLTTFPVLRGGVYYVNQADMVVMAMLLSELYEVGAISYILPEGSSSQDEYLAQIKQREAGLAMRLAQRLG